METVSKICVEARATNVDTSAQKIMFLFRIGTRIVIAGGFSGCGVYQTIESEIGRAHV